MLVALKSRLKLLFIAALVLAVALVLYGLWRAAHPTLPPFQGQMEARVINVSSKIPGRIAKVNVHEGDSVVRAAADAKSRLVHEGVRAEQLKSAEAQYERAAAQAELAKKSFSRLDALFKEGLISAQKHDEARAALQNAVNARIAAKSQWDMAANGARVDEKVAAAALAEQAREGVAEVTSLASEALVKAPRSGEVSRIVLEAGEVTGAGFPLVTLVDLSDSWAVFNIREDEMAAVKMGGVFKAEIPALNRKDVAFTVYYISPRADYATWRSTKQSTGYDMRTFEVRARPTEEVEGLRPGMSIIVRR